MRPGQNRRVRGRNRNTKGPNPLTRAYESNGPDVKIRGTAQHIADKYAQLARDAQASGDPVAAENYLQHGEHYFRMIAAAQEQFRLQYGQRPFDEDGEEGEEEGAPGYAAQSGDEFAESPGYAAPSPDGRPYEPRGGGGGERPMEGGRPYEPRSDRPPRFDNRNDRGPGGDRQSRGAPRFDRPNGERFDRPAGGERFDRPNGGERFDRVNGPDRPAPTGGERFDRPRNDRPENRERFGRNENREGAPRDFAGPREPRFDRDPRPDPRPDREPRPERDAGFERRPAPFRAEPRGPTPDERDAPAAAELPAFLTNPIRPILAAEASAEASEADHPVAEADLNGVRPARRRRVRKADPAGDAPDAIEPAETVAE